MKNYIAVNGDTWDSISYRFYNSEFLYSALFDANRNYADIIVFNGGEIVNIPDNVEINNQIIPTPWNGTQITVINPPWGTL